MSHASPKKMPRRIDELYFKKDDVRTKVQAKKDQMMSCAQLAKKKIQETMAMMVEAVKEREKALLKEVDDLTASKLRILEDQVERTEQYSVRSDQDKQRDLWLRLRTDEVVDFKPKKLKDLQALVTAFGEVDGTSTYASESSASGPLVEGPVKVGKSTWLLIKACDLYGKQRKEGGDKVCVKFSDDDIGPSHFSYEVEDLEDGTYKLKVVPEAVGNYTVTVGFEKPDGSGDETIPGSPFSIRTQPPFDYTILGDDSLGQAGVSWSADKEGFLMHPIGLEFDPLCEFVFVADQCNHRVQAFEYESRDVVCSFGKRGWGPSNLNSPGYIVVDRESRVIVSDILNHRVQVLHFNKNTRSLSYLRSIGTEGRSQGKFHFPRGIAMTQRGLLVVCDSGNSRIQIFDMNNDFAFVRMFGDEGEQDGQLDKPFDIAVNSKDELLVTDDRHRVQVFDLEGKFLRGWGKRGRKNGQFRHATSITVDDEDGVFVCDQGNHRVQVFSSEGTFTHKWGGYLKKIDPPEGEEEEAAAGDDGAPTPLDDAFWYGLMMPAGITVSSSGTVLVSDYKKNVVFDFSCGPSQFDTSKLLDSKPGSAAKAEDLPAADQPADEE